MKDTTQRVLCFYVNDYVILFPNVYVLRRRPYMPVYIYSLRVNKSALINANRM